MDKIHKRWTSRCVCRVYVAKIDIIHSIFSIILTILFLQSYYNSCAYSKTYNIFTRNSLIKTFIFFIHMKFTETLPRSCNWSEYK